jgi:hypothetical protein
MRASVDPHGSFQVVLYRRADRRLRLLESRELLRRKLHSIARSGVCHLAFCRFRLRLLPCAGIKRSEYA